MLWTRQVIRSADDEITAVKMMILKWPQGRVRVEFFIFFLRRGGHKFKFQASQIEHGLAGTTGALSPSKPQPKSRWNPQKSCVLNLEIWTFFWTLNVFFFFCIYLSFFFGDLSWLHKQHWVIMIIISHGNTSNHLIDRLFYCGNYFIISPRDLLKLSYNPWQGFEFSMSQ